MKAQVSEWFGEVDAEIVRYVLAYGEVAGDPVRYGIRVGIEYYGDPPRAQWIAGKDFRYATTAIKRLQVVKEVLEDDPAGDTPLAWHPLPEGDVWDHLLQRGFAHPW